MSRKSKQFSAARRKRILAKTDNRCWYCGQNLLTKLAELDPDFESSDLEWDSSNIDHVQPSSRGGSNEDFNLVACCKRCNIMKSNRNLEEFRASLSLAECKTPLERSLVYLRAAQTELLSAERKKLGEYLADRLAPEICRLEDFVEVNAYTFYGERLAQQNSGDRIETEVQ